MKNSYASRILVVAIVLPVLIAATGVLLALAWLPDVPSHVALQWAPTGEVTTTGPSFLYPLLLGGLGLLIPLAFGGSLASTARRRGLTRSLRMAAGASLALTITITGGLTWSFWAQRGLPDAAAAPAPLFPLLISAVIGVAVSAVIVLLVLPSAPDTVEESVPVAPMALAGGQKAAWFRTVVAPPAFFVLVSGGIVLATVITGTLIVASGGKAWMLALVPTLLVVLLATTSGYRVRVDEAGVSVRSLAGFPRFSVPISDIRGAAVTDVAPMADFGGWGFRTGTGGRFGVVVRAGEALEVERASGRRFVVTVDDAGTAASLLVALAERRTAEPIE